MSIRNDIAQSDFCFPSRMPLQWKLKDFLEENVDEKYYLTKERVGRLIKKNNKLIRNMENPEVSSWLIAGYHKMVGGENQYIAENNKKVKRVVGIYDTEKEKHQAGSVYDLNGISPALTDMSSGGNKQPFVLIKEATK